MVSLLALLAALSLHLTAKDNGKVFSVKAHETIVVTLSSNRSKGYRWGLSRGIPGYCMGTRSHRYIAPKKGSPRGAPGREVWRFWTIKPGCLDKLHMVYRPKQGKIARYFRVELLVG